MTHNRVENGRHRSWLYAQNRSIFTATAYGVPKLMCIIHLKISAVVVFRLGGFLNTAVGIPPGPDRSVGDNNYCCPPERLNSKQRSRPLQIATKSINYNRNWIELFGWVRLYTGHSIPITELYILCVYLSHDRREFPREIQPVYTAIPTLRAHTIVASHPYLK